MTPEYKTFPWQTVQVVGCGAKEGESMHDAKPSLRLTKKSSGHPDGNRFRATISGTAGTDIKRRVRDALHAANPRCHWCARVTEIRRLGNQELPPSTATLDHLVSRFFRNPKYDCEVVLACYRCNQDRAIAEHQDLTPEEVHERSTRPPRKREAYDR